MGQRPGVIRLTGGLPNQFIGGCVEPPIAPSGAVQITVGENTFTDCSFTTGTEDLSR